MAVILYQVTGIFYKILLIQLIRIRPPPAVETAQTVAASIREPLDAYRVIPERNLFATKTNAATDNQASAVYPQQDIAGSSLSLGIKRRQKLEMLNYQFQ